MTGFTIAGGIDVPGPLTFRGDAVVTASANTDSLDMIKSINQPEDSAMTSTAVIGRRYVIGGFTRSFNAIMTTTATT